MGVGVGTVEVVVECRDGGRGGVCVCMCVYLNDAFQALLAINVTLCANKRGTDKFFFFK